LDIVSILGFKASAFTLIPLLYEIKSSWHRDCFSQIYRNNAEPFRSGVILAEDILDEMDEDFDDDVMGDLLDDSLTDAPDAPKEKGAAGKAVEGGGPPKKKLMHRIKGFVQRIIRSKKAIIIMAISLVLLTGLVLGAWFFLFREDPEKISADAAMEEKAAAALTREEQIVFEDIVDLEPFERISLKSSSTMGLISMTLSLELTDQRYRKQVYTMEDRIRKIITGQAEEMTWLELRSPEGKIMFKYGLLQRINSIFPNSVVRNIYFTTFIMQR
jgi:flagellar FliL protein